MCTHKLIFSFKSKIDQPTLGLNRIYLVQTQSPEHAYKTAYVELIEEIWEDVYPNVTNRGIIAKEIVEFETKLAEVHSYFTLYINSVSNECKEGVVNHVCQKFQISTKPEDRRDRTKLYNPMTIAELSKLTRNATVRNLTNE